MADSGRTVYGVIGGSSAGGVSLNPDGSFQDSVGKVDNWSPPASEATIPPFDAGAADPGGGPVYPDLFTYADGWWTVHQDGLYLVQGYASASAYSDTGAGPLGSGRGWFLIGATDEPYYLSGAFQHDDSRVLTAVGASTVAPIIPLPAGGKVAIKISRGANVDTLTINYVDLTITQVAVL